jgi:hypothetical protein
MAYITKTVGDKIILGILLTKDGIPLPGLTPTLELRRNADGKYFDFSAVAPPYWITVGGQLLLTLPEISWLNGFYSWDFDQGVYDTGKKDYTAIYRNPSPYAVTDIDVVSFDDVLNVDVSFIRKMLANKQTLRQVSASEMEHIGYTMLP